MKIILLNLQKAKKNYVNGAAYIEAGTGKHLRYNPGIQRIY